MSKPKKGSKGNSNIQFKPLKPKKNHSANRNNKSTSRNHKTSHSISEVLTHRLRYAWKKIFNLFVRSRISSAGTDEIMSTDSTSIVDPEPAGATDRQTDKQEPPTTIASIEMPTSTSPSDIFLDESAKHLELQPIQEEVTPAILVTEPPLPTSAKEPVVSPSAALAESAEGDSPTPETSPQNKPQVESQVSSEHSSTPPETEENQSESSPTHPTAEPPEAPDAISAQAPTPDNPQPYLSLDAGEGSRFKFRIFRMEGSSSHAYQDAADADPETGFVAIADGTTLGGYSEIVSEELVRRFVQNQCNLDDDDARAAWWIGTRKIWYAQLRARYNDASSTEQSRWDKGGSATFMGLRICDDGTYNLHNVGDCSLLWFNDSLTNLIHIDGATSFNSHPCVLHTDQENPPTDLLENRISGKQIPSTTALLVTDALAKLFQEKRRWEKSGEFGEAIRNENQEFLSRWFSLEKENSDLEPDDFTFILLDIFVNATPKSEFQA